MLLGDKWDRPLVIPNGFRMVWIWHDVNVQRIEIYSLLVYLNQWFWTFGIRNSSHKSDTHFAEAPLSSEPSGVEASDQASSSAKKTKAKCDHKLMGKRWAIFKILCWLIMGDCTLPHICRVFYHNPWTGNPVLKYWGVRYTKVTNNMFFGWFLWETGLCLCMRSVIFNICIARYDMIRYDKIWYDRRKFRSETSDNMDSWKAEVRRVRREKIRRKKMQMREKVGKSRFTVFFQWFVAPEGRKVGSLKRRVRTQLARWEMKKCTPLWREAHFQVKMYKKPHGRATFWSCDVEKVHAVVARSTFPSQNVQNTPFSDHFWKLRCRKSARRCGAKHIFKSKCTKHTILGPLLEVEMSKKCTPLWREAHFQVKMYKTHQLRTTFGSWDDEKVHAVVARSTFGSQKC